MLRKWLKSLFSRSRRTDLDEELQFHLDHLIAQKIAAGISPEAARRAAAIEFGSLESVREQAFIERPTYRLETTLTDLRYALRGCVRNPSFAITVVLTFALSIGATTAVFSVIDRILFRPLPYADSSSLVSVGLTAPIMPQEFMLGGSYYTWRDNQTPFSSFSSETGVSPCDLTEEHPVRLNCAGVEASLLPTLGVAPIIGRNFTAQEDVPNAPKVALISDVLWQQRFHRDPSALNKLLTLDGQPFRIIGVLPNNFEMPALEPADVVVPQALDETAQRKTDPGRVMYAFARLKPGVSIEEARRQLQPVFNDSLNLAPPPFRKEVHLQVRNLRDRQMHDVRPIAWVLFGVVLTVLLICCANVAGLLTARAAARERELAVRAALGASRTRLLQQSLIESLVLAMAGAVVGTALAYVLLRAFVAISPEGMPFLAKAALDPRILAFTLIVSLGCGFVCGVVAAFHNPRAEALAGRNTISTPHARLRQTLVVVQIAASFVLLSGGALLVRSFWNLESQRLGFATERIVTASVSLGKLHYPDASSQMQFFQRLERALRYGPGVSQFAMSDTVPPGGYHHDHIYGAIAINGVRSAEGTGGLVAWRWVSPDYFRLLGIPLLEGAAFTEEEVSSTDHFVILSRTLADRMFPAHNAVGQHLQLAGGGQQDPIYTVAGVVADAKNGGLTNDDEPEYYRLRRNRPDDWNDGATFILKTNLPLDTVSNWLRSQVAELDPTAPIEIETLSQRVRKMATQPLFETALVGLFAATGLTMAVIGLYGVISFLIARRTQEIGLRMAVGATRADVLKLLLAGALPLIITGTALGLIAALALSHLLASLLFNVGPHDPVSFAAVTFLLVFVAIVAALFPASASTRLNPMDALRCD